jgi:cellulose synthase/poly-beta-1,6-N-acetylglucosamine synthase-like glycosyltransferase
VSLVFTLMFAPLWLLWWANRKLPEPGPGRPPVDIVVPAYNEEDNIVRLLRSIDVAAHRYGGPVRVVISDDGSTDSTARLAAQESPRLRHAQYEILTATWFLYAFLRRVATLEAAITLPVRPFPSIVRRRSGHGRPDRTKREQAGQEMVSSADRL